MNLDPLGIRHLVVVGASKGLGANVVKYFAQAGWNVSFGSRNTAQLEVTESELKAGGFSSGYSFVDVRNLESVVAFFSSAKKRFGQIHAVVHLAATNKPYGTLRSVEPVEWADSINTNLLGTFYVLKSALLEMEASDRGDIVVLSGGGATAPMPTLSAYAASKSAIVRLVESVALEEKNGRIRINALAPGIMDTGMVDEVIEAGSEVIDEEFLARMRLAKTSGEDSTVQATKCIDFLLTNEIPELTGLLISAKWDDWQSWDNSGRGDFSDPRFRLRRISPGSST